MISPYRCQGPQRLWKVFHSDDPEPVGITPRLCGVIPGRDEEDVHTCPAGAERLLLHAADLSHRAVRCERAGGCDLPPVGDITAGFLEDVEREREPGGRAPDPAGIDPDAEGQPDLDLLLCRDADDRPLRVVGSGHRPDRRLASRATAAKADRHRVAGLAAREYAPEFVDAGDRP